MKGWDINKDKEKNIWSHYHLQVVSACPHLRCCHLNLSVTQWKTAQTGGWVRRIFHFDLWPLCLLSAQAGKGVVSTLCVKPLQKNPDISTQLILPFNEWSHFHRKIQRETDSDSLGGVHETTFFFLELIELFEVCFFFFPVLHWVVWCHCQWQKRRVCAVNCSSIYSDIIGGAWWTSFMFTLLVQNSWIIKKQLTRDVLSWVYISSFCFIFSISNNSTRSQFVWYTSRG